MNSPALAQHSHSQQKTRHELRRRDAVLLTDAELCPVTLPLTLPPRGIPAALCGLCSIEYISLHFVVRKNRATSRDSLASVFGSYLGKYLKKKFQVQ